MAQRLLRDPDADGWERSDMPIVCESCLGPNPFVRMQRIEFGGQCHISGRPYTVFRWRPGNDARYKKTIICQEVAKQKNVCQVCLLDLSYNLPVQVRDTALGLQTDDEPQSDVGKEFKLQQQIKDGELGAEYSEAKPNDMLLRLQRTTPYYKRNQARICSFFVKGTCTRGAECPYRHEMPQGGELADQNIKDRYYGINDPVANKMLRRAGEMPKLEKPEDQSITTLFIGGLTPDITDNDLRDHFYAFGEISGIRRVDAKACAFLTYTTRSAAERAAEELYGKLIVKGQRLRISWGKPQQPREAPADGGAAGASTSGASNRASMLPPQVAMAMGGSAAAGSGSGPNFFNLPPGGGAGGVLYPSMDPQLMGTRAAGASSGQGESSKRPAEAGADASSSGSGADNKRPRGPGGAPAHGAPPPQPMMPPQMGMPPPGYPPQYGGCAMPPPGMVPPPGYGAPPPMMPPPGYGLMPPPMMAPTRGPAPTPMVRARPPAGP